MAQKTIKIFVDEIYSNGPKKKYSSNKTHVYHIDDIWSLDIINLKDYLLENNRGYRYVLVITDNFNKFVSDSPFKKKCSNKNKLFPRYFDMAKKKTWLN